MDYIITLLCFRLFSLARSAKGFSLTCSKGMQLERRFFDVGRGNRKRLNIGCVLSAVSLCSQRRRKRTCVPGVLFEPLAQVTAYSSPVAQYVMAQPTTGRNNQCLCVTKPNIREIL